MICVINSLSDKYNQADTIQYDNLSNLLRYGILDLKRALDILSNSSPYAVSTEREEGNDELATYKDHIYIKTQIEDDFLDALKFAKHDDIVFLCGSSGDGKSEILTRYSQKYKEKADFHLDATHSFAPTQNAIQALDERFSSFKNSQKPLIVGINVGMLGNYAEEGASLHDDIKASIKAFLENKKSDISCHHTFLDFEQYPKFTLGKDESTSDFAAKFLEKLTRQTLENPFYVLYDNEVKRKGHSKLTANFALLGIASVQKNVIALLLSARLIKEQFLTARGLLDLVHKILTMDNYLFDNLFSGADNELLEQIQSFDPCNIHTRKIDEFILQFELKIEDPDFISLNAQLNEIGVYRLSSASSYLRLLYLLKDETSFSYGLTDPLKVDFDNQLVNEFASIWLIHNEFDGSIEKESELFNFYEDTLISAVRAYCNRNCSCLDQGVYFISKLNSFVIAAELEIEADFPRIQNNYSGKIGIFNAYLLVDGHSLQPIPISVNLLDLLNKINKGYRPNKHDKNAVLLLTEIADQIICVANGKNTLFIHKEKNSYKVVNRNGTRYQMSDI